MQLHSEEIELINKGLVFAGTDEAGRGCLAGPVVAASVILRPECIEIPGVNDSKKLTAKKRSLLTPIIEENCLSLSISSVMPAEIDNINILNAALKAMEESVAKLGCTPDFLLVDGNRYKNDSIPFKTIVSGDALCLSIAAASIIAKVARDRLMVEIIDVVYPEYGFAKHKGYGTAEHYRALERLGPTPFHRKTFLRKFDAKHQSLF